MRLVLVLTALALAAAGPASASAEGGTGGVTVPPRPTGGMAVPGELDAGAPEGGAALPAGGAQAGAPVDPPAGSARSVPARSGREAGVRAQAAQEGQPDPPPTQEAPDEGDVDVQVPLDEGAREPGAEQPASSAAPFGGLASTGLALAGFALLGAAAAAAGFGLHRLAR